MIGIYKITSPKGRIYIGQSLDIKKRLRDYIILARSKGQIRLQRSFIKYGFSEHIFEVVEECEIDQLNVRERYWQDFYDVLAKGGLNCKLTQTSELKQVHSEETRNKMSQNNRGTTRAPRSEEHLSKLRGPRGPQKNPTGPRGPRGPQSQEWIAKRVAKLKGAKYNKK